MMKKREDTSAYPDISSENRTREFFFDPTSKGVGRKKILLHSCCGPCSTSVIEQLRQDYDITVFYYNPCITEPEEYEKRKKEQIRYIEELNCRSAGSEGSIDFIEGTYRPEEYLRIVEGLEDEPEGGKRCEVCFLMRLTRTADVAVSEGYPIFTTTLSVSPHKNYSIISDIGKKLAEERALEFLDTDFKKNAGFQRSVQLSREYNLYRQDYCGCRFSKY